MQMNKEIFAQTDRLVLRKFNLDDYLNLCGILQDEKAMYAYEGAFSDGEVQAFRTTPSFWQTTASTQTQRVMSSLQGICSFCSKISDSGEIPNPLF